MIPSAETALGEVILQESYGDLFVIASECQSIKQCILT